MVNESSSEGQQNLGSGPSIDALRRPYGAIKLSPVCAMSDKGGNSVGDDSASGGTSSPGGSMTGMGLRVASVSGRPLARGADSGFDSVLRESPAAQKGRRGISVGDGGISPAPRMDDKRRRSVVSEQLMNVHEAREPGTKALPQNLVRNMTMVRVTRCAWNDADNVGYTSKPCELTHRKILPPASKALDSA